MSDSNLRKPNGSRKSKRIVGRGASSRRGATAGRGTKGQNSRSGGGVAPGFEGGQMPLYRRLARRGFNNARFSSRYDVVSVGEIGKRFQNDETVNATTLVEKRLVKRSHGPIKILAGGDVGVKLLVEVDAISAAARVKIEEVGGTISQANQVKNDGK